MALRRQLCLCVLLLPLLQLVLAFLASPVAALPAENCYETVMRVPKWCAGEFIVALFAKKRHWISRPCCNRLVCVRELSCFSVLQSYCVPQAWQDNCF
ncbi:hypothetical protein VPH35_047845 [Triticum aestivum]